MTRPLIPLLGGTFDPIHHGHLRCAWEIARWMGTPLRLLPSGQPMHREPTRATARQRLEMLTLAIADQTDLIVDPREIERGGPTWSVDTLTDLRRENPQAALCFVLGADAFAQLHRWKDWRRLVELTHFVVVTRPGHQPELPRILRDWVAACRCDDLQSLARRPAGGVIERRITPLEISASAIRSAVTAGDDPIYLVPESVRRYIDRHGLYRA